MTIDLQETPEVGELVLATIREITSHGAYVTLEEYGGLRGFLHVSEVSTGWVRNVYRFIRLNQKSVLKVIRTSRARAEIDLSLRQVSGEERKEKLIAVKKADRAKVILENVRNKMNLNEEDIQKYSQALEDEFDSPYDALEEVVRKGPKVVEKLDLPPDFVEVLDQIAREKIVIPSVAIKGEVEIITDHPDGRSLIHQALSAAQSVKTGGAQVTVTYLGSSRYKLDVTAETYKTAEKVIVAATEKAKDIIVKKKGKFSFKRD
ncbi:MAG: S1 RNA-binding domain-containing protein [Nitrososphaerales archaeon]